MSEREIYVEHEPHGDNEALGGEYIVCDENAWLASFINKEDAEEFADRKRLEP